MQTSPRGSRLHIAVFGRRNAGKSSLLNALTGQQVSIVSDVAGTTTDPVEKSMELQPLGPVQFIDTAGLDDEGDLGRMRVEKSLKVLERTDIAILAVTASGWSDAEARFAAGCLERKVPVIVVFTQADRAAPDADLVAKLTADKLPVVITSSTARTGLSELRQALIRVCPDDFLNPPSIVSDLLPPGGLAVLVVPIDKEAPKGRLILPQVQTIRDLLDGDQMALMVKERELRDALARLGRKPDLVITDSQAFLKVAADTPDDVPMTSFSVLFARYKGDLDTFAAGAAAIEHLKSGDRVLIAENCTHHPIGEDIGRVKIPRWLTQYVGGKLETNVYSGHDFPTDLSSYQLAIHCGGCTTNRREVLSRIERCREAGVPITNYGVAIATSLGITERALAPFPSALEAWRNARERRS
jgi:[FeFe] hydrogenase H-cluster maturation GTPase HydF